MLLSRRAALLAPLGLAAQTKALTAGEVVARIQKAVAVPWRDETVDTLKTGGPETVVRGIATTFMSTLDVMQRAVAEGKNMIITHEPTFYAHDDSTKETAKDPTLLAKKEFVEKNQIVVFRFHDHWHARQPDGIRAGMMAELGWTQKERFIEFPKITLRDLAAEIKAKLKIRSIRVIGDPAQIITQVIMFPGYNSLPGAIRALNLADALVIGEAREWEVYEFTQDMIASGKKKSLIVLGHAVSEEGGMKECAKWLKTFISEVPIAHVPAGEPFWTL